MEKLDQEKTTKHKTKYQYIVFLISFIYFGIFRYLIIPSGDDYFWYGDLGKYLMHHNFFGKPLSLYGGSNNGRYLGNLLQIFTMHHMWIAVFVFGLSWTVLIWGIWSLSKRTVTALILSCLFAFTLQAAYIDSLLVWNSGFSVYVPGAAIVITYLVIVQTGQQKQLPQLTFLLTFILGIAGGLFNEATTILQLVLGVIVLIYLNKKMKLYHVSNLLGGIIAAMIMFRNPAYSIPNPSKVTTFDPKTVAKIYYEVNHYWVFTFNQVVLFSLLLAILILTIKSNFRLLKKMIFSVLSIALIVYYIWINNYFTHYKVNSLYAYSFIDPTISLIDGSVSFILIIFIGYSIVTFFKKDRFMWLYCILIGASVGILMFVQIPVNVRGYFLGYTLMYIIALKFVLKALDRLNLNKVILNSFFLLILLMLAGSYQYRMYRNYQANLIRVEEPGFYNGHRLVNKHVPYRYLVHSDDRLDQQVSIYWNNYLKK